MIKPRNKYGRFVRVPATVRFVEMVGVQDANGCWEWQGTRSRGYGKFSLGGKLCRAHRFSWELAHGRPVPDGMNVLHHCDNPPCVRPSHLFIGTHSDNMLDSFAKGRKDMRGANGHNARLRREDVLEIRRLHSAGATQVVLSRMFRTARSNIGYIVRRETWTEV